MYGYIFVIDIKFFVFFDVLMSKDYKFMKWYLVKFCDIFDF